MVSDDEGEEVGEAEDDSVTEDSIGEGRHGPCWPFAVPGGEVGVGASLEQFVVLFCALDASALRVGGSSTPRSPFAETLGSVHAPGAGSHRCLMAARTWSRIPSSVAHAERSCLPGMAEFRGPCPDLRAFSNDEPSWLGR